MTAVEFCKSFFSKFMFIEFQFCNMLYYIKIICFLNTLASVITAYEIFYNFIYLSIDIKFKYLKIRLLQKNKTFCYNNTGTQLIYF